MKTNYSRLLRRPSNETGIIWPEYEISFTSLYLDDLFEVLFNDTSVIVDHFV